MCDIFDQAETICHAAGTSLSRALRMGTIMTDLAQYPSVRHAREGRFPEGTPVTNVIGVQGPLQVPGCTIITDLWIAA